MQSAIRASVFGAVLCLLSVNSTLHAQGVGASGEISGTVLDPANAAIPNAKITVSDPGKGLHRTVLADSSGQYRVAGLPPSHYRVTAEFSGFQAEAQTDVVVTVGQVVTLDFHLKIAKAEALVEVSSQAPVVETERSHQSDTIEQQYIEDLPINRRDYLTFTLLAPGVTDSTRLASDQDFRVKQTPQSGLSFYGSNGRGNSVTVDGGEANDDSGGVRLTLSQEAVQEFQINRSNYGAELGGASGATINIVSKSGTNVAHGSLFGFFRNDALDARNPFSFSQALQSGQIFNPINPDSEGQPIKDSLSRQQYGGSIGFPIKKDKTFLFAAFEGLRQDAQNAVPLLTNTSIFRPDGSPLNNQAAVIGGLAASPAPLVPCLSGPVGAAVAAQLLLPAPNPVTLLPPGICSAILGGTLTLNPNSPVGAFDLNQLESNGGLFNYNTRTYYASGRLDHRFSDQNQVYVRYSFAHDNEQNPDVQSLVGFSAGSSIHAYDNTLQAAWFHQFSSNIQNEARGQYNYTDFNVIPNEPGEVGLNIPGFANLGTNIFLPNLTIMRRYEGADNVTVARGSHTMKFGGYFLYRGNHTESHTFSPGRFGFGNLPGGLLSPCLQVPAACGLSATTLPASLNSLQSANFGLPQFYQQGFGNPIYNYPRPFGAFFWQDEWAMTSNFRLNYGIRYEVDAQYGKLTTDKDNFAPRVGFAWDPLKNHRIAIRGGFGIYYSPIYGQIADVVQTLGLVNGVRPIAQVLVPITGAVGITPPPGLCPQNVLTSACIYGGLFAAGPNGGLIGCTAPAPGQAACITPQALQPFGINITNTGPVPPLTVLFSGQPDYQSPYSEQASFGIDGEIAKDFSVSLSGIYSHTLRLPVALDTNLLSTAPVTTAINPFNPQQQVTFQNWGAPQCTANPFLCFANPLIFENNQYSSKASALYEGLILEVKKRLSSHVSLIGNYTFSKAIDTSTDFNSDFAPQNQLTLGADRGLSDFDQRHKVVAAGVFETPWKGRGLGGWQLSPIVRYNSGHPFNVLAGGTDINGDRHSTNDRPLGFGRNTGLGPDFVSADVRLTKAFKIYERTQLQFIAEGFNVFNRTNFASVNNEVPTLGGFANIPIHPNGFFVNPAVASPGGTPLAFTSALPMRQIQLGFRLDF